MPKQRELYNLEKFDPKHRTTEYLLPMQEVWRSVDTDLDFYAWLDVVSCHTTIDMPSLIYGVRDDPRYVLALKNGLIYQNNELLDTSAYLGKFPGYTLFVLDENNIPYSGEYVQYHFNHASFTAGESVKVAALLKVKKGKIESIAFYSGHYEMRLDSVKLLIRWMLENSLAIPVHFITKSSQNSEFLIQDLKQCILDLTAPKEIPDIQFCKNFPVILSKTSLDSLKEVSSSVAQCRQYFKFSCDEATFLLNAITTVDNDLVSSKDAKRFQRGVETEEYISILFDGSLMKIKGEFFKNFFSDVRRTRDFCKAIVLICVFCPAILQFLEFAQLRLASLDDDILDLLIVTYRVNSVKPLSYSKSLFEDSSVKLLLESNYSFFSDSSDMKIFIFSRGVNDCYLVEKNNRRFVFRVYTSAVHSIKQILSEHQVLLKLFDLNYIAHAPVLTNIGMTCLSLSSPEGRRYAALFFYLEGVPFSLTPKVQIGEFNKLGFALGRLHLQFQEIETDFNLLFHYDDDVLVRQPLILLKEYISHAFPELIEGYFIGLDALPGLLCSNDYTGLRMGIVHGDPHYENFIVNETYQLIDFEFLGYGPRIYDLATLLLKFYVNQAMTVYTFEQIKDELLFGYQNVCELTPNEHMKLNSMLVKRYLFWLSMQIKLIPKLLGNKILSSHYFIQHFDKIFSILDEDFFDQSVSKVKERGVPELALKPQAFDVQSASEFKSPFKHFSVGSTIWSRIPSERAAPIATRHQKPHSRTSSL